jgi:hypothetical protein
MRYKRKIKEKEMLMNLVAKEEDPLDKQLAKMAIVNEKVKKLKEGIPWNASKEDKKNFLYRWQRYSRRSGPGQVPHHGQGV